MFRNFYCSNLSVLFIVRKFNLTLLEVELLLNIKDVVYFSPKKLSVKKGIMISKLDG